MTLLVITSVQAGEFRVTGLVKEFTCCLDGFRSGKSDFLSLLDIQNHLPVEVIDDSLSRIAVLAGAADCVPVFYDDGEEYRAVAGRGFVEASLLGKAFGCEKFAARKGKIEYSGEMMGTWLRPGADSGRVAPGFVLADQHEQSRSLRQMRSDGKMLLAFVRSGQWDPLSQEMLRGFFAMQDSLRGAGFAIAVIHGYEVEDGKKWCDSLKLELPLLSDPFSAVMRGYKVYDKGNNPFPAIILIDTDGVIRWRKIYGKDEKFEVGEMMRRVK